MDNNFTDEEKQSQEASLKALAKLFESRGLAKHKEEHPWDNLASMIFDLYSSFIRAGFNEEQALELTITVSSTAGKRVL